MQSLQYYDLTPWKTNFIPLVYFRISPVSKDDGIPRKFAFKAEHQNMRTYYFASDSRTNMVQWMNALSLASILQSDRR